MGDLALLAGYKKFIRIFQTLYVHFSGPKGICLDFNFEFQFALNAII